MNKTTEALLARIEKLEAANKLAEEALEDAYRRDKHAAARWVYEQALTALSEALAEPVTISCDCGDIYERNSFGGKFICDAAKPVQEPVISDVPFICNAYESGFGHGAKNDGLNDGSIFTNEHQGEAYEFGYAEGLKRSKREPVKQEPVHCHERQWVDLPVACDCGDVYPADSFGAGFIAATGRCQNCDVAAPVSAKREWVYLTDDEIDELIRKWYSPDMGLLEFAWAVIVAFEDKNK